MYLYYKLLQMGNVCELYICKFKGDVIREIRKNLESTFTNTM